MGCLCEVKCPQDEKDPQAKVPQHHLLVWRELQLKTPPEQAGTRLSCRIGISNMTIKESERLENSDFALRCVTATT